jgi:hypothetical protein
MTIDYHPILVTSILPQKIRFIYDRQIFTAEKYYSFGFAAAAVGSDRAG